MAFSEELGKARNVTEQKLDAALAELEAARTQAAEADAARTQMQMAHEMFSGRFQELERAKMLGEQDLEAARTELSHTRAKLAKTIASCGYCAGLEVLW